MNAIDYQTWIINGEDIHDVGPQEAAECWRRDHPEATGVVVVRDRDGLIAGEWSVESLDE